MSALSRVSQPTLGDPVLRRIGPRMLARHLGHAVHDFHDWLVTLQYPLARPVSLRASVAPRRSPVAKSISMHSPSPTISCGCNRYPCDRSAAVTAAGNPPDSRLSTSGIH